MTEPVLDAAIGTAADSDHSSVIHMATLKEFADPELQESAAKVLVGEDKTSVSLRVSRSVQLMYRTPN